MDIEVKINDEVLIYSPPINEYTKKWGVYAIPRMWMEPTGELIVRFNGEEDSACLDEMKQDESIYFKSCDNGENWEYVGKGNNCYDISVLTGINPPYLKLKDSSVIAVRYKENLPPIAAELPFEKEFAMPNGRAIVRTYSYGSIPGACKGMELICIPAGKSEPQICDIQFDFDEREVWVDVRVSHDGKVFYDVPQYVQPYIFKAPYFSGLTELTDGTLVAVTCGRNPNVSDHYCSVVYLVASEDGGITWRKRGIVAESADKVPYGYGGAGAEVSLTKTENDDLFCVMRMDMCVEPNVDKPVCDTMFAVSKDGGYTWTEPVSVADSSVTPHIVALKDGILLLIYGRPGVHMKYSTNNGITWSDSISLIGLTLEQERMLGRSDADSKYFGTSSYSNTFVEKLSEDTVLVIYNNVKYMPENGEGHKAAFVKQITLKKNNVQIIDKS